MSRKSHILSISLPDNLTKAVDTITKQTDQSRSELVRNALREYLLNMDDDRARFLEAYRETRKEKLITMDELRTRYQLN